MPMSEGEKDKFIEIRTELEHWNSMPGKGWDWIEKLYSHIQFLLSIIDRLSEELVAEKKTRIKYQDIVYKACLLFDKHKNPCTIGELNAKIDELLEGK
jgi:hypothetical protein